MKTQNINAKRNWVVVGVLAAAALIQGAQADEVRVEAGVPVKTVAYKDLNLDTQAGVQVLYRRIHGAANQVCGNVDVRELQVVQAHKGCVDQAMANAVAAVNNQMLAKAVTVAQVR